MDSSSIAAIESLQQVLATQQKDLAVAARAQEVARAQDDVVLAQLEAATELMHRKPSGNSTRRGVDVVA